MKKKILISLILISAIIMVALVTSYLLSLQKVSFSLHSKVSSATIYRSDKQKVKRINSDTSALLKEGEYYVIAEGTDISQSPIGFTVTNRDMKVNINPNYSDDYLKKTLIKEEPDISSAIEEKYPSIFSGYTLSSGTLYKKGEWFGGLLKPKVGNERDRRDPYRIVLHKKDDEWEVIRRPEYILTSSKYKNVPVDVLRAINSIVE